MNKRIFIIAYVVGKKVQKHIQMSSIENLLIKFMMIRTTAYYATLKRSM